MYMANILQTDVKTVPTQPNWTVLILYCLINILVLLFLATADLVFFFEESLKHPDTWTSPANLSDIILSYRILKAFFFAVILELPVVLMRGPTPDT